MREVHSIYLQTKPQLTIGFPTFCKLRPDHVDVFGKIPENVYVCQVHENLRLLLVALNSENNDVLTDLHSFLDKVVCSTENKTCMSLECAKCNESVDTFSITPLPKEQSEDIRFYQWERNEDNHTEKTLNYGDYGEVFDMPKAQLRGFLIRMYVKRLQQQYFESLHDNVNTQGILSHIIFSENFSLTEQNVVQSAHWTNNRCALFTVHLWVNKNVSQRLTYVSDCLDHEKVAIHNYVHSILQFVRENYDIVEKVYFFSDDPSS